MRATAALPVALGVCLLGLASCAGSPTTAPRPDSSTTTSASTDATTAGPARSAGSPNAGTPSSSWSTYHRDTARSGRADTPVGPPLHHAWTARLRGAVYGEPLVVGSTLVVATEQDLVYGLSARTGRQRWRTRLGTPQPLSGLPCGDIDPLGITGTPAYDPATGSVFVVAETLGGHHTLWALDARSGARRWHRGLDVEQTRNRRAEQQRSALLVTHGRVVVAFGGLAGDCDDYVGYLTSTSTSGAGAVRSYAVPTAREAGIWSPAGPVQGPNGNVYVASGNGAETNGRWDHSDSVLELTSGRLHPVGVFAPRTWRQDNAEDLDLGSSSPVGVGDRIVIGGKRGTVYLLRERLGGIGSALATVHGCRAFGGAAVVGGVVVLPCRDGIRALTVGERSLRWRWSAPGVYASPVTAGRFVYAADPDSGDLVVLRLSTGHVVQRLPVGALPHFPSAAVAAGRVFVGTLSGVSAFRGS
jgi:outer membrane protein assembly factor BamB